VGDDEEGLMAGTFARRRDGSVEARLSTGEQQLLVSMAQQLRERITHAGEGGGDPSRGGDPGLRRLFPPAYEDDAEAQAEYAGLTSGDLREGKLRAIDAVVRAFEGGKARKHSLDLEEAEQLLAVLNDARLTLGTELDVTEELDVPAGMSEREAARFHIYAYLGWLEEQLVEALDEGR
jgi:hypothetical protein